LGLVRRGGGGEGEVVLFDLNSKLLRQSSLRLGLLINLASADY
jgi:hypothetical protein